VSTTIDVEALETLYRERLASFVRVAAAIAGDWASGTDAVQEAFAKAIRRRETFRGDGPLEAWVWRIVINAALAARRPSALEFIDEADGSVTPLPDDADRTLIRQHVASLPERQRLVIFLRYFADLDYASIAEALDVSVGTVSATLSAAHEKLRKPLKEVVR
jgi:RNA polymerase sigma factor (sigma-70 family)